MFVAKRLTKLSMFLAGCIFGLVLPYFMSSLIVLTTTDSVLSKAVTRFGIPPQAVNTSIRSNWEVKPQAHLLQLDVPEGTPHGVSGTVPEEERRKEYGTTVTEREQFQQAQVKEFCNLNIQRHSKLGKHIITNSILRQGGRHILTNSVSKTAFCFAPKVGCTNLKILFFTSQGALPRDELLKSRANVSEQKLEAAISKLSLASASQSRKDFVIANYYKFIMYRHPIERLFSAYRSKVQKYPLQGLQHDKPHYNWLRMKIFKYKHQTIYHQWHSAGGNNSIRITFSDFIDYWLHTKGLPFDEHFQSIYDLCQPCQVHYNYYGNFKTFTEDAEVLVKRLKTNSSLLKKGYHQEGESATDLAPQYYQALSHQQKNLIINELALDLSFYYTLFPFERDSHKVIMSTDVDVPKYVH